MNLTIHSKLLLAKSASEWEVEPEYYSPMYRYLIHGLEPGSFFSSLLSNDWFSAISRSHPANTITALKHLSSWIETRWPKLAFGSDSAVWGWTQASELLRRSALEEAGLIYSSADEVVALLKQDVDQALRKYNGSLYKEIM
jgi:hypothetical protein